MPETSTIPRGVRAVRLDAWRNQFAVRYGRDGNIKRAADTIDRQFRRARESLLKL